MITRSTIIAPLIAALSTSFSIVRAAEMPGHAAGKEPEHVELETELYIGRHGYWHVGLGAVFPLSEALKAGLEAHMVREGSGATEVPSFGAEVIRDFGAGLEVEALGFVYPEVESLHAWGMGLRATKAWKVAEDRELSLFFGPSYARAKGQEEDTARLVTMHHLMLLGGVTLEAGPVAVTLLGSHSFYNRDPVGVESPVDLVDMTHFAAYENNDGFVRDTAVVEVEWAVNDWLTLHLHYAALWFEQETRHAVGLMPAVKLSERVELQVGVELLRGGQAENDLVFTGVSLVL